MFRIALAAAAIAAGCVSAQAAQVGSYNVGNWLVGVHTDDTTGRFGSCIGSVNYNSGITMFVAVSRDLQWDLGFSAEHWRFTPGERISLQYRFDRSNWAGTTAEAMSEKLVKMPMPSNGPVAQLFRRGRMMEVNDGNQSFFFNLQGTSRLLLSLVQCVDASVRDEQTVSSNSAPNASAPSTSLVPETSRVADIAALKLEGTRVLSNFLLAADLGGAEILGEQDFPKELSFAHAVAITGDTVGFSLVVPASDMTPDALSAQIAGTLSESCDGKFGTGSTKETVQTAKLINGFTACEKEGVKSLLQYVVVSRKQGGLYVIGVLSAPPEMKSHTPSSKTSSPVTSERLMNAAFKVSQ